MPPSQTRQSGRYNKEKDVSSNRKPHKKELTLDEEVNQITDGSFQFTPGNAHEKVEKERPKPEPTYHQKQQAFMPSRSHIK